MSLRVGIVGAGIGGLTFAHALRRQGIDFVVFDRDAGPDATRWVPAAPDRGSLRCALVPIFHFHKGGFYLAKNIRDHLIHHKYDEFMDVHTLGAGDFERTTLTEIAFYFSNVNETKVLSRQGDRFCARLA